MRSTARGRLLRPTARQSACEQLLGSPESGMRLNWMQVLPSSDDRSPEVLFSQGKSQEREELAETAAQRQNMRSAGLSVPKDPTFAIARLIRIWLSLRALPIESLRSSTLNPQQSVLYAICEIEYRNIDCR